MQILEQFAPQITANAALWFAIFVTPLCIWAALSDLRHMRIPNYTVYLMLGVFAVIGLIVLPFQEYVWRYLHVVVVLLIGMVMTAARMVGAGDAKFSAAAAPFIAVSDLRLMIVLFTICLLAGFITHRVAKHSPLRTLAPEWESWHCGWKYPMGLSLGATLSIYLILGALYGQ